MVETAAEGVSIPVIAGLRPWRRGCPIILRMARLNVRQVVELTKSPDSAHPLVADRAYMNGALSTHQSPTKTSGTPFSLIADVRYWRMWTFHGGSLGRD